MSSIVESSLMKPGDVLLYRSNTPVSKMIRFFDKTEVSHAGLYLGDEMVGEALFEGVVRQPLKKSIAGCEKVIIKRHNISFSGDEMIPVLEKAQDYLDMGNRYAFEQIILLALVCAIRNLKDYDPSFRTVIHQVFRIATKVVDVVSNAHKEAMICSEFVYRSYSEALFEPDSRYLIKIDLRDEITDYDKTFGVRSLEPCQSTVFSKTPVCKSTQAIPMSLSQEIRDELNELDSMIVQCFEKTKISQFIITNSRDAFSMFPEEDENIVSSKELERMAAIYIEKLRQRGISTSTVSRSISLQTGCVNPDFVTPGDLLNSPTLKEVGILSH